MKASRNFKSLKPNVHQQAIPVSRTSGVQTGAKHSEAGTLAPTTLTRDQLSAAPRTESPQVQTTTAKIKLYTAAELIAGRNLTNESSPEECKRRFDHESRLLEENVIGVINNKGNALLREAGILSLPSPLPGNKRCPPMSIGEVNGILSTFSFGADEDHKHALIWPYETQGPNAYTPAFSLYEDKDFKSLLIINAPDEDGSLSFRHHRVNESYARYYNKEFNPTTPIKPGETVIRVLRQRPDRSYREEILTDKYYASKEGRVAA